MKRAFLLGLLVASLLWWLLLRALIHWAHSTNGTPMPEALLVRRVVSRSRRVVRQKMGRR